MNNKRKRRLTIVTLIIVGMSVAVGLTLYALQQNINLFYTPSQVVQGEAPPQHRFRLGGMVKKGSIKRLKPGLQVQFTLKDNLHEIQVQYTGILPDLFREEQGIVTDGKLNAKGVFVAERVLAKHDENYMPPALKEALEKQKRAAQRTVTRKKHGS